MNFDLTDDQRSLRDAARRFARNEMASVALDCEKTNQPPSRAIKKQLAAMGFLGINMPVACGGMGLGNLEALLVLEEFAKVHPAVAFPIFESAVGPIKAVERFGTESLKARLLPKIVSGDTVVAVAMSEPDAGTALTDLATHAVIKDGRVVINGTKRWCTGGGTADGYVVYCRIGESKGAKGVGAVYVPAGVKGLSFGAREELMGFRGTTTADIFFEGVEVPEDHLIVPAGGFPKLMEAFDLERCGNATMCLGLAAGALEDTLAAGALCEGLRLLKLDCEPDDSALIARDAFLHNRENLADAIRQSGNARRLLRLPELRDDVKFCLRRDALGLVAVRDAEGILRRSG